MKKCAIILGVLFGWAMTAQAVTSPSSLIIKVFEMRVSRNSDCSSAVSVFNAASPTAVDFIGDPDLGSGVISTGTYHCVMFHISDIITFTPENNIEPLCVAGTTYSYDFFQSPKVSVAPNGASIPATAGEDDPWIYLSDAPSAAGTNGCLQPTKTATGGPCPATALAILSDQTHTLVMDADNQLGAFGTGTCILNPSDPIVFSIR